MPKRGTTDPNEEQSYRPPATTPEARENQLIALAVDLAEEQLRKGSASSQVITHFLKLGSSREGLEQRRISLENDLVQAKTKAIASHEKLEVLYQDAMKAMQSYSGQPMIQREENLED